MGRCGLCLNLDGQLAKQKGGVSAQRNGCSSEHVLGPGSEAGGLSQTGVCISKNEEETKINPMTPKNEQCLLTLQS